MGRTSFVILMMLAAFNFTAHAGVYFQVEANKLDVESDMESAKIGGTGFGGRAGYKWSKFGLEAGYTSAKAELDGQIFSATDTYEATFKMITAGFRWWMIPWLDLSGGVASVKGDVEMSITHPILGAISGSGDYSSTGMYLGLGVNVPISMFDIFAAYTIYRWSETDIEGMTGVKSDTGVNTISGGLRVKF